MPLIDRRRTVLAALSLAALPLAAGRTRAAAPGVRSDRILFGQSAAFDGPAKALGTGMRDGIQAAFAEINGKGGVHGREVELISYDDGYEPERTIANVKKLLNEDGVFALIGPVGTPTSKAVMPIAIEHGAPFIGPFTGAEAFRTPFDRHVVNVRASYFQETEALVDRLTTDLGASRIAVFYQDDSYGHAGCAGVKRALDKRSLPIVADGNYERNTTNVKNGLIAIRKGKPDAVIVIGAYKASAEFTRLARQVKLGARIANVSFVGADALAHELGDAGGGVIVSQVVPFPKDGAIPLVAAYRRALQSADPAATPGFVSLEGYLAGRLVGTALARASDELTRENFLGSIYAGPSFDIDGAVLSYAQGDNQGMDAVYLTVIQADGLILPVDRLTPSS